MIPGLLLLIAGEKHKVQASVLVLQPQNMSPGSRGNRSGGPGTPPMPPPPVPPGMTVEQNRQQQQQVKLAWFKV